MATEHIEYEEIQALKKVKTISRQTQTKQKNKDVTDRVLSSDFKCGSLHWHAFKGHKTSKNT